MDRHTNRLMDRFSDHKADEQLTEERYKAQQDMNDKLDKFIDRVTFRVKEAL